MQCDPLGLSNEQTVLNLTVADRISIFDGQPVQTHTMPLLAVKCLPPVSILSSVAVNISSDKLLAFSFGVFFALILLFIAFKDREPTQMGILIYRVILALVAAGIGAVIPGMISVTVNPFIRAGGAIALFAIVFWFNPPSLVAGPPKPHRGRPERS